MMFTFEVLFTDGTLTSAEHIVEADVYQSNNKIRTVSGDAILTNAFLVTQSLVLRSETGNCAISCDGIRSISITKEA